MSSRGDPDCALPGTSAEFLSLGEQLCFVLGPEVYEEVVNSNPYADSDEQASPATSIGTPGHTALPEPSPTSIFTQPIHSKSREELGPGVEFWSFPPDDAIRSLIPKRLNVPIKEGHDHLPKVETSEISKRTLSRVASFDYSETRKKKSQSGGTLESIREVDAPVLDETSPQIEGTHKKLFGKNGWLEGPRDVNRALSTKHNSNSLRELGKRIKQQLAELVRACLTSLFKGYIPFLTFFSQTVDVTKTTPSSSTKMTHETTAPITLDPTAQSKLYSELECMVCNTANDFLMQQYYDGRISSESIRKTNAFWGSKNRPRVTEFRFDQATQREIIMANRRMLNFTGEYITNPILMHSNLRNWKAIAREMSIRTFCLPDSAIRKHLHDIRKLLEMLNAPLPTLEAFHAINVRTQEQMMDGLKQGRGSKLSFAY
ncbi:hypothetical protein NUU61_004212 [Penicillium alfredii]|uniref:Uncharacterized protein n=1 Tax=Penicillium alfredii TaxID=1506179 RepID=A0A9W9FL29_9EURO|nr:uncharacterized protein NUU61_004212 [Penicillium alfredii]KAJ5101990.1 hypothetical protein NUU61_004212 [Penicillium alfredii]